jgi:leukotriene-A4 hydrolase
MLVLPPSFPYGGMENPRMTFLTPTLLAGDRSLVDVVAHELAHSWTGNLVTNADMEHFWLNEGFTVWAERRLLEALHGEEAAVLAWAIGERALEDSLARFEPGSPLTHLRTELAGTDPDDAFSSVPYEKGARFVTLLERTVGRERFDKFMRDYVARFRFTSITTEEFLAFLEIAAWSPAETLVYLQSLPREIQREGCAWLDAALGLTSRGNHEILVEWLIIAAGSDYEPAFERLRGVLLRVGRMKYLRPLYAAMGRHPRTRSLAREVFTEAAPRYHGLSRRVAASVIEKYDAPAT